MDMKMKSNNEKHLSNEQLLKLYKKNNSTDIRNRIILNNIGLIYVAAKKRINLSTCFTFDDLVQEGVIGMIKGIEKYDVSRNTNFSTYAYYWIVQQMDRAIVNNGYLIRLPAYMYEKVNIVSTVEKDYLAKNREIDVKNLCEEINIDEDEYYQINYYKKNYYNLTSLNYTINLDSDESYMEFQDYIPNDDPSVEDIVFFNALEKEINEALNTLTPKERDVLELRFGLNGKEPSTLETIGNKYQLTRERIRQIENKALIKLNRQNPKTHLKDYLI